VLVGLILLGVGVIDLALAVFLIRRTRSFLERAVAVTGTVTGFAQSTSSDSGVAYHPIVRFETIEGETHEFQDSLASNPPSFKEGESVPVKYEPTRPDRAKIAKTFRIWLIPGMFTVSAVGLLVAGGIVLAVGTG
jgi:hypothetical protein